MRKTALLALMSGCVVAASLNAIQAAAPVASLRPAVPAPRSASTAQKEFTFKDGSGNLASAPVADDSAKRKLTKPVAKLDPTLSPTLAQAATIAQERANAHSKSKCWRYVKEALLAAGAVDSYPKTEFAKEAGAELVNDYGFKKLPLTDPYAAPIGAVLVYTAKGKPGHVEIRTKTGFVSDFKTETPSKRELIGIYAKA